MKILYIVHDNKKGGAAISFLDMIKGISKEHEVYVLTPHKYGYIPEQLDKLGIWHKNAHYYWWEIAKVGSPFHDKARFVLYKYLNEHNRAEAEKLAEMAIEMGIDIIHSNSSVINIGAMISQITGIPHVWHLRELALPEYPIYPVRKKDTLQSVFAAGNNTFIAISEYAAKFYSEYTDSEIITVYNGISSSYDHRKSSDEYGKETVSFLISGNFCEEKGQMDVAEAARLLISEGVTNFKIYMAGMGDFSEVREYALDNGLMDHIELCGLVGDMPSLRKKCDVEIVASWTEAFGRVTIEAMRASDPVIGTAMGGTVELIEDGVTGFLYGYRDNKALAEHMKKFTDRPGLAAEMGSKAYEWSVGRFTSEENVRKVLKVYEKIAKRA